MAWKLANHLKTKCSCLQSLEGMNDLEKIEIRIIEICCFTVK